MIAAGIARIGNEPALRSTQQGQTLMDLSLAFNYGKKGTDGKYPTQWIRGTMWGDRCEKLIPYLEKGQQIFVELTDVYVNVYEKKEGGQGVELRARINNLELIGNKQDKKEPVNSVKKTENFDDLDDDIPFN